MGKNPKKICRLGKKCQHDGDFPINSAANWEIQGLSNVKKHVSNHKMGKICGFI
jgi:hypothetical protein